VTLIPATASARDRRAVVRIFAAASVPVEWERVEAGAEAMKRHGTPLPDEAVASIRRNGVALKGRLSAATRSRARTSRCGRRSTCTPTSRPVKNFPGRRSRFADVDLVIVRENTEGEYAGLEHRVVKGVVESIKVTTAEASTRIARFAFALAAREKRRKVTASTRPTS
jgi:isocitrate dehydrogenase (NAD+)